MGRRPFTEVFYKYNDSKLTNVSPSYCGPFWRFLYRCKDYKLMNVCPCYLIAPTKITIKKITLVCIYIYVYAYIYIYIYIYLYIYIYVCGGGIVVVVVVVHSHTHSQLVLNGTAYRFSCLTACMDTYLHNCVHTYTLLPS